MAGLYGPERKPLGHPATTRLLDKIAADNRREEAEAELQRIFGSEIAERTQRERNEQLMTEFVLNDPRRI